MDSRLRGNDTDEKVRSTRKECASTRAAFRGDLVIAAVAAFLVLFLFPAALMTARAADGSLSEEDRKCLNCHSSEGLKKNLANGETLSLHVPGEAFAKSVHGPLGCAGCHANVNLKNHLPAKTKIVTAREYSITGAELCRRCHEDKFKQYEGSIHATLLREGNQAAPVCTDCHSPHSIRPKAARESIAEVPCRKCHETIFKAYAESVHGRARSQPGRNNAPICADCHRAHDVRPASTGEQPKNACLGCHAGALSAHERWLPNTERHLETVSCPACHAPGAQRRVDLRLYDSVAQKRVSEKQGVPQFETRARSVDAQGHGLDAMALRSLLREFNREGTEGRTILRGRLEVRSGVEAHQLADKTRAVGNCDSCHREGADPFQSVTVSIVGPDGRPLRYGAHKEVLTSAISVDSVGGFYAIGGTRIKLLDVLLVLAVLGGAAVPVGHLTLKWLFRRYLKRGGAENASGNRRPQNPPSPGGRPGGGDRG
ncbi:MAG: cytochrome c3 family protein [Betaproteobacteria bacterium]|nr:cytochrome c3 family protein [Betaproteobacteria bacterium]